MSKKATQPEDRRIQRTRRLLRTALMHLVAERGYEQPTVQDIADRAGIGRATFYLHYPDKEHLLLDCVDIAVAELALQFADLAETALDLRVQLMAQRVFEHMAEQAEFYRALMGEQGVASLAVRVRQLAAAIISHDLRLELGESQARNLPVEAIAVHTAGALLALGHWWLEHEQPQSAHDLAQLHWRLSSRGLLGLLVQS
jgi:AcrR family transcriptional regulator